MENIFGIYKLKGPTSHDIVDEIRKITGMKKVGHAGTLDPLAQGVLVVGVGRLATKKISEIVSKEKEYIAKIFLGEESTTDDAEGEKTPYTPQGQSKAVVYHDRDKRQLLEKEKIEKTLKNFVGKIKQVPPQFSAKKVGGKTAYKVARQGKTLQLEPKEVEIKSIEILSYSFPHLTLHCVTGPGVYIRTLARDLGRALETGAYLADLERTRVGEFTKSSALNLEQFKKWWMEKMS